MNYSNKSLSNITIDFNNITNISFFTTVIIISIGISIFILLYCIIIISKIIEKIYFYTRDDDKYKLKKIIEILFGSVESPNIINIIIPNQNIN